MSVSLRFLVGTFCSFFACGVLPVVAAAEEEAENNRYNVVFIAIDDLRPDLGCYGDPHAQTPNLDRLAKQGMMFSKHYVQVATCGASRFALLTGRSPATSGVTRNNNAFYSGPTKLSEKQLPGAQTLPEQFRRSGYHTVLIGKVSHTADGLVYAYDGSGDGRHELPHAWDDLATPLGEWKRGWGIFFAYTGGRHRESGMGDQDLMEFTATEDNELPDGKMADEAVAQLKKLAKGNKPFFMGLGFFKPHLPFVATKGDWEAVQKDEIASEEARTQPDSPWWHASGEFYRYDFPFKKTRPLDEDAHRQIRAGYRACVRYVDRQVGKVLAAIEELDLDKETIVVIWGDHGWHLGEQQVWGKHTPWERAVHSPLIIKAPEVKTAGKVCDALVETIDIYPTLVDLCRPSFTKTEKPLDGVSLVPLLNATKVEVNPAAISYWRDGISVRRANFRLVYSRNPNSNRPPELYDMSVSPDNQDNVADKYPDIVKRLRRIGEEGEELP